MKVLVYFQPSSKHDNYEGARMRKTIKGALEVIGATYTTNLYDDYDVAHFMSPDDENKLNIALERNVPIVVSALFGEDDPTTRFLNHKNKDGKRTVTLKAKALKMLNKANLILVPCESAKEFLIANGVNKPIETIIPGVNLARFNFSREDEKELFYRYFREDKNKKLVLAVGEYTNNMDVNKPFYASYLKQDNKVYAQNNLFGANWQSKMTLSSDKDLKVAGKRSAGKMFKEWIDSDQEAKERFGNTSYFSFNKNLNSPDVRDQKLFSRFYSFMGSKGYDAVHDWNDQYETKTKSPLIIFGSLGNISVSDIQEAANYKPPTIKKPEIHKVSVPRAEVPKVNINRTPISKIDVPKTASYEDLVKKNRDLLEQTFKSIGY